MMNMDAENTALLIRSLLACIKQHESTLSAALFKLAEKTKTIEHLEKDLTQSKRGIYNLQQQTKLVMPKRGRGRPRKVKP